ncbi:DUF3108 domain-containing protein [Consotaella aegiceratis]|uniref:DUF3108 domain-containing protein n=1 Tax=Consotaella aegiceratis TaxID=3097961 RepID=UPI002F415E73
MLLSRAYLGVFLGLALGLAGASPLRAEGTGRQSYKTVYQISLIGFIVGRATFHTTLEEQGFSVEGELSSAGLADLFAKTRGTSSVKGSYAGEKLLPNHYALAYEMGDKAWSSRVDFAGGRAVATQTKPEDRNRKRDFIAVEPDHLASVVDPLSGLMIRKGDGDALCQRTVAFYDGWTRLDLILSPAGQQKVSTDGYSGDAIVCKAKVRPVSGYRRSNKQLKFMRDQTIELRFAPIGDTDIYAPVRVRVPTEVGPLTITASTFAKR